MKVMIIGASSKPSRYAYTALNRLTTAGHEVIAIGAKEGEVNGIPIITERPRIENLDTITLYINPHIQKEYMDYILELAPKRIIFNPGTENPKLMKAAKEAGIEVEVACTLVMLSTDVF